MGVQTVEKYLGIIQQDLGASTWQDIIHYGGPYGTSILIHEDEEGQWYDDAYAYEDSAGKVIFRYNLTWERLGSTYYGRIRDAGISLEEVDPVILPSDGLRWLPIEIIAEQNAKSFLEVLDEACAIPKPGSIAHRLVA